ncbi:YggT family protein [Beggiatoa leptomitoformis]|uniref:YggT family protein n=1 Tax=Beggiatoa leptomitoformis TaxID=288004 RepID=A0A2N9YDH4_9GAMM|nr:YggT family protein [Beggiatoa leptomitoformis]ALG69083.1 YggT family protein [Beggiatoa leptomitoformis]AUI68506.1 YggT family protein [Beggiatoa leptomitoformis]
MSPVTNALVFLINALFGLYILLIMLRFLLTFLRIRFNDASTLFLLQLTDPPLRILYTFIPRWRTVDIAALVLILALTFIKLLLTVYLFGQYASFTALILRTILDTLSLALYVFFWAIILRAILSWVELLTQQSLYNNPVVRLLDNLTEPLLAPVRRRLPPTPGIDISPLIVGILLYAGILLLSW